MKRREFVGLSGLAAFGLALPAAADGTFDYPWKLGIITDEVSPI